MCTFVYIRGLHTLICRVTVTCRGRKTTVEASFSTSIQSHVIAARSFVSRFPDIRQTFDPFPRPDVLKGTYAPRRNSYRVTPRVSPCAFFFGMEIDRFSLDIYVKRFSLSVSLFFLCVPRGNIATSRRGEVG